MTTVDNAESTNMTNLIQRYITLATTHGEATEDGNSEVANNAYHELLSVFHLIIQANDREKLVPLLAHSNPAVRAKAAFHTYKLDTERSSSILEEVSNGTGLVAFSAGMTLKQLKSGGVIPP
jgi:hypothetical protein